MPPVPPECRDLSDEVDGLLRTKRNLQEELRHAPPPLKPGFVELIEDVDERLVEAQEELGECLDEHRDELPEPVVSAFEGSVTVEIDHDDDAIRGPHEVTFTAGDDGPTLRLRFGGDRRAVKVSEMTPVEVGPFETPLGEATVTVTRTVNRGHVLGAYDPETGRVEVPLDLLFDVSRDVPLVEEDAPVRFDLTTGAATSPDETFHVEGEPVDVDSGSVVAVGASQFVDTSGPLAMTVLGGRDVSLVADGRLVPAP